MQAADRREDFFADGALAAGLLSKAIEQHGRDELMLDIDDEPLRRPLFPALLVS